MRLILDLFKALLVQKPVAKNAGRESGSIEHWWCWDLIGSDSRRVSNVDIIVVREKGHNCKRSPGLDSLLRWEESANGNRRLFIIVTVLVDDDSVAEWEAGDAETHFRQV